MRNVLRDPALQAEFDKLGYVILPEFISKDEVETLKKAYFETLDQRGGSFLSEETDFNPDAEITYDFTFIDRKPEYKKLIFKIITERLQTHIDKYLDDYLPIIANFIYKKEAGGEVPLHQNWAFVDERKCTSVSVWIPLVDSNEENGTLQMVDGSHKRFGEIRGPLVPWELADIGPTIIDKYLTPMNVNAGQAVILDDSVVHYSNINQTSGLRLTIQVILIPADFPAIHYQMLNPGENTVVQMLEVDHDFFMHFHPWNMPKGKRVMETLPFKKESFTEEQFKAGLKAPAFDSPDGPPRAKPLTEAETQARLQPKEEPQNEQPEAQTEPQPEPQNEPQPEPVLAGNAKPQGFFQRIKSLFS